jgi:hypothetical protein
VITLRNRVVPTPEVVVKSRKVTIDEGEVENDVEGGVENKVESEIEGEVENEGEGDVENLKESEEKGGVENESNEEKSEKEGDYGDLPYKKKSLGKEKAHDVPNVKLPYPIKKKKISEKQNDQLTSCSKRKKE